MLGMLSEVVQRFVLGTHARDSAFNSRQVSTRPLKLLTANDSSRRSRSLLPAYATLDSNSEM